MELSRLALNSSPACRTLLPGCDGSQLCAVTLHCNTCSDTQLPSHPTLQAHFLSVLQMASMPHIKPSSSFPGWNISERVSHFHGKALDGCRTPKAPTVPVCEPGEPPANHTQGTGEQVAANLAALLVSGPWAKMDRGIHCPLLGTFLCNFSRSHGSVGPERHLVF